MNDHTGNYAGDYGTPLCIGRYKNIVQIQIIFDNEQQALLMLESMKQEIDKNHFTMLRIGGTMDEMPAEVVVKQ